MPEPTPPTRQSAYASDADLRTRLAAFRAAYDAWMASPLDERAQPYIVEVIKRTVSMVAYLENSISLPSSGHVAAWLERESRAPEPYPLSEYPGAHHDAYTGEVVAPWQQAVSEAVAEGRRPLMAPKWKTPPPEQMGEDAAAEL